MTLRQKILSGALLTVVLLGALGAGAYLLARDAVLDGAQQRLDTEAQLQAKEISGRLAIAHGELASIAEWADLVLPVVEGRVDNDPSLLDAPLAAVVEWWQHFTGFAVVDAGGTVVRGPENWAQAQPVPAIGVGDGPWASVLDNESVQLTHRLADSDLFVQALVPVTFVFDGPVPGGGPVARDALFASAEVDGLASAVTASRSRADVLAAIEPLLWLVIGVGVVGAAAVALGAWWLARQLVTRLTRLQITAQAIGAGDWAARSGDRAGDELGALSESVDKMAAFVESDHQRRRSIEDQLAHQALHDPLTGLANRAKFLDRLDDALARSSRSGSPVAVLFCDLDNLKVVNDDLGHHAGDDLLTGIAQRFRASIRPSDTVARFGGDEFVVLCAEMAAPDDARVVADRLISALGRPFQIQGQAVQASASIGIAVGSGSSTRPDELLADADAAMYTAKRGGKGRYVLHQASLDERMARRADEASQARRALDRSELTLLFQPILELTSGALLAVEAFVRWQHPDRGVLYPHEFLPQFADADLLADLDHWVIDRAAAQIDYWNSVREQGRAINIAVNLSRPSIRSAELARVVEKAIDEHRIRPEQLLFDVAESMIGADPLVAAATLDGLRALGVGICVDDFGTGQMSAERLRRFGADLVKIDAVLIAELAQADPGDGRQRVTDVLALASGLGIDAVAEGVEHLDQVPELIELGCRYAQGHLFCGPLDDVGVLHWIERVETS